jgi:diguanylate cyclase (GGDEF)-like protein
MFAHDAATTIALDISTLMVVATCVTALLGLLLLFAWAQERIRALAWWGAAYLIGGFSAALWMVDGAGISLVPPALPSALLFLACGMIWSAARLFHGRSVMWIAMPTGAVAWLFACSYPTFALVQQNRFTLAATIISIYTFLTAAELWRERRKSLIRRCPALFVPALHGAVFLFPIPLASFLPEERGVLFLAGGWIAVFALETILYAIGTAFIVLVLSKEHTLRLHKTAALTDPLTGLLNRRGFIDGVHQMMPKLVRNDQSVCVLLFDLDHFKMINDRLGHAFGDRTLKLFASTASANMRMTDLIARIGGEEFTAVIPGTLEEGIGVAERVRVAFEEVGRAVPHQYVGATVSIGVVCGEPTADIDTLLAAADQALYADKAGGRNRVETFQAGDEEIDAPSIIPHTVDVAGNIYWTAYQRPRAAGARRAA